MEHTYDDEISSVHLCLGLEIGYRLPSKIWTYRIAYVQTWTFSQELKAGGRSHSEGCLSESVPDCEELEKLAGASKISAPSGRRAEYFGPPGRSFVDWIEWIPTVRSKKAVASISGFCALSHFSYLCCFPWPCPCRPLRRILSSPRTHAGRAGDGPQPWKLRTMARKNYFRRSGCPACCHGCSCEFILSSFFDMVVKKFPFQLHFW